MTAKKNHTTKKGRVMAFTVMEDSTAAMEVMIFPELYDSSVRILKEGEVFSVRGRISRKDGTPKLLAESVVRADTLPSKQVKTLFINLRSDDTRRKNAVAELLRRYAGVSRVRLCYMDTRAVMRLNDIRGVRICTELTAKLAEICGKSNIIVK